MSWYFGLQELMPASSPNQSETNSYIFQSNQNIASPGVAVGAIQAATQNETQTITAPGSGNYYLSFLGYTTTALAYTASDATIQAALRLLPSINGANVTVASKVVTFMGALAGFGQPLLTDPTLAATIARTTAGWTQYTLAAYSDTVVANPTAAPSLALASTDGSWGIGAYLVSYTFKTAGGESIPSPAAVCAVLAGAATAHIAVGSITGIPNFVTSVNVYVNDIFVQNQAVTSNATGAFNLLGPGAGAALHTPLTSTAYLAPWGAMSFVGFTQYGPFNTNQFGQISPGLTVSAGDQQGSYPASVPVYVKGRFNANDLSGIDAATLAGRGTVEQGSITTGVVRLF